MQEMKIRPRKTTKSKNRKYMGTKTCAIWFDTINLEKTKDKTWKSQFYYNPVLRDWSTQINIYCDHEQQPMSAIAPLYDSSCFPHNNFKAFRMDTRWRAARLCRTRGFMEVSQGFSCGSKVAHGNLLGPNANSVTFYLFEIRRLTNFLGNENHFRFILRS